MKKTLITVVLFLFIGIQVYSQTKKEICDAFAITQQDAFPGTEVTYHNSTLIIKYPLSILSKLSDVSTSNLRSMLKYPQYFDVLAKMYINKIAQAKSSLNNVGFYYIQVGFIDDYYHNYKEYISKIYAIKFYH